MKPGSALSWSTPKYCLHRTPDLGFLQSIAWSDWSQIPSLSLHQKYSMQVSQREKCRHIAAYNDHDSSFSRVWMFRCFASHEPRRCFGLSREAFVPFKCWIIRSPNVQLKKLLKIENEVFEKRFEWRSEPSQINDEMIACVSITSRLPKDYGKFSQVNIECLLLVPKKYVSPCIKFIPIFFSDFFCTLNRRNAFTGIGPFSCFPFLCL